MKTKQALVLGLPLIASCLFLAVSRGYTEPVDNRIVNSQSWKFILTN